ncbi:antitoxin Xre/MbcA/ParS toxin-binding domain-containing protein [Burkholderia sp. Bp8963]|uniref:antitoxin Xre/MbcA/ParS toxin-binding domain-containing protein n=1 Tax=Burkholderia sp. Bp8963 TaxID=2184547 RepID=UPI0026CC81BE|nr:antitoxin Xre/MbcA/ParS toxin-binding domain-containing protein [Burkholderia sp. Bp8963]
MFVDRYNFYYGYLRGSHDKWLDLYGLFADHVLPSVLVPYEGQPADSELLPEAIQYFTAKIIESVEKGSDSISSQARYHTALRKLHGSRVQIIEGYYSLTKVRVPRIDDADPDRQPRECDRVSVWKLEEKQSDVNLAINAYHDALTGQIDHAVIVSNDTDLVPALWMIRTHTPVIIGLVVPTRDRARRPNADLAKHCHWVRDHLTDHELADAQLPRVVRGGKNATVKPDSWYPFPELFKEALELAIGVRGSRSEAFKWFDAPSPFFDGLAPMTLMATEEGLDRVIAYMKDWILKHETDAP